MATGNDDNPNNGPNNPFAYVLIPVLGFGLIVAVITCYRYRRKKARLARLAEDPEYQRQLEEGRNPRTRLDRGPNGVIIIADRGGRRGGRSRRLGLGAGMGSREEGLNELGEAPPAYTASAPKPPSEAGAEHIELTTYSQATAEAGMSRSPPLYDEAPPSSTEPQSGPAMASTSGARDSVRSSEEMGDTARNATGHATDNARTSEESRGESAPNATTSSAGDAARTSEETRGHTSGNAPANGAGESAGMNEETREDNTENATTTTTTATTEGTTATTTTPTTDEPTAPPRAILPSS